MVHLACRVDLSHLDSKTLQVLSRLTFMDTVVCRLGILDARSREPRGNIHGHHLHDCGCVGMMRTSDPSRGVYVTYDPIWI